MRGRVLAIDDDVDMSKSFSSALSEMDCEVERAVSLELGIEKARAKQYDLIYIDLNRTESGSVELLAELHRVGGSKTAYILTAFYEILSGHLEAVRSSCREFHILRKPIGIGQVISAAKRILERPPSADDGGPQDSRPAPGMGHRMALQS